MIINIVIVHALWKVMRKVLTAEVQAKGFYSQNIEKEQGLPSVNISWSGFFMHYQLDEINIYETFLVFSGLSVVLYCRYYFIFQISNVSLKQKLGRTIYNKIVLWWNIFICFFDCVFLFTVFFLQTRTSGLANWKQLNGLIVKTCIISA